MTVPAPVGAGVGVTGAAGAAGATAEVIGILKTDIGLVPAHF